MNYDPMIPIWAQVATQLKRDMVCGKLPPGAKLPGGRDLAVQYGINPNTAARVYQELEREGLCQTRRGLGTYVTTDETRVTALRRAMALRAAEHYLQSAAGLGMSREEAIALLKEEAEHA